MYYNYNIMTKLEILQYPDARLRVKADPVEDVMSAKVQQIIDDMLETLHNTPNCIGLSATQLNLKNPQRITVLDTSLNGNDPYCLINPVITSKTGSAKGSEGCMSVYPEYIYADVKRAEKIVCEALDRNGKPLEIAAEGLLSCCIQHEIDHLDGILFIDHLSPLKRKMLEKKMAKLQRAG